MFNTGNLGGLLYYKKEPLCHFKFHNGMFLKESVLIVNNDENLRPLLIRDYSYGLDWQLFFEEQVVPSTRYKLLEDLASCTPIREYIPEQILRYQSCRNWSNHHWVQCDDDLRCWEPWQIEELRKSGKI